MNTLPYELKVLILSAISTGSAWKTYSCLSREYWKIAKTHWNTHYVLSNRDETIVSKLGFAPKRGVNIENIRIEFVLANQHIKLLNLHLLRGLTAQHIIDHPEYNWSYYRILYMGKIQFSNLMRELFACRILAQTSSPIILYDLVLNVETINASCTYNPILNNLDTDKVDLDQLNSTIVFNSHIKYDQIKGRAITMQLIHATANNIKMDLCLDLLLIINTCSVTHAYWASPKLPREVIIEVITSVEYNNIIKYCYLAQNPNIDPAFIMEYFPEEYRKYILFNPHVDLSLFTAENLGKLDWKETESLVEHKHVKCNWDIISTTLEWIRWDNNYNTNYDEYIRIRQYYESQKIKK
jgi:hypothetical protein